jgi:hypothetical protein
VIDSADVARSLADQGFALISGVFDADACRELTTLPDFVEPGNRRGVKAIPAIAALAGSDRLVGLIRPHFETEPKEVRGLWFDKAPESNWPVAWHQDLTIAVERRIDVPGYGPWSLKHGVHHVQPLAHVLDQILTVRLHLDMADEQSGALRVIPGSHREGRLSDEAAARWRDRSEIVCRANVGDILLMRPLLLHASHRTAPGVRRRVLHLEYAAMPLPGGLAWSREA